MDGKTSVQGAVQDACRDGYAPGAIWSCEGVEGGPPPRGPQPAVRPRELHRLGRAAASSAVPARARRRGRHRLRPRAGRRSSALGDVPGREWRICWSWPPRPVRSRPPPLWPAPRTRAPPATPWAAAARGGRPRRLDRRRPSGTARPGPAGARRFYLAAAASAALTLSRALPAAANPNVLDGGRQLIDAPPGPGRQRRVVRWQHPPPGGRRRGRWLAEAAERPPGTAAIASTGSLHLSVTTLVMVPKLRGCSARGAGNVRCPDPPYRRPTFRERCR